MMLSCFRDKLKVLSSVHLSLLVLDRFGETFRVAPVEEQKHFFELIELQSRQLSNFLIPDNL